MKSFLEMRKTEKVKIPPELGRWINDFLNSQVKIKRLPENAEKVLLGEASWSFHAIQNEVYIWAEKNKYGIWELYKGDTIDTDTIYLPELMDAKECELILTTISGRISAGMWFLILSGIIE